MKIISFLMTVLIFCSNTGCAVQSSYSGNNATASERLAVAYEESTIYADTIGHNIKIRKKDGQENVLIFEEDMGAIANDFVGIQDLVIYHNDLYIQVSGIEWLMFDLVNNALTPFLKDVNQGAFYKGGFYYIDHAARTFSVYCKNLDDGAVQLIRGCGKTFQYSQDRCEKTYDHVIAFDDQLYFTTRFPARFYRYDVETDFSVELPFSVNMIKDLYADGDYIYFLVEVDQNIQKWKCKIDDSDELAEFSLESD